MWIPSSTGRVHCVDEEDVGDPTARGNLLDNPVEDDVPIIRGLSLRELDAAMAWQMPDTMLQNTLNE
ncbi:MAG: hypothetical protein ACLQUY_19320 [Ktedonobacterales bacterium]